MGFTLGEIASPGLPVGEHVVRIDDIEASMNADKTNETMVFKVSIAQSEDPKVKVGSKHIWSYTYGEQWRSIIANDLIRAGLSKDTHLEGSAKADAVTIAQQMRNNFYVISVRPQKAKKGEAADPTRTNTNFLRPFNPGASAGAPTAAAPTPVAAAAPPSPAPAVSLAPAGAPGSPATAPVAPPVPPPPAPVHAPATPLVPAVAGPIATVPATPPNASAPQAEGLTPQLIQAITLASQTPPQGNYPPLNVRQIEQLGEIGWSEIQAKYREAAAPAAAAPPSAFQSV